MISKNISKASIITINIKVDIKEDWTFIKKAIAYYRFRPYAMKILKENRYDFVIVWGSYTGHLFKSFLEKHYQEK